MNEFHPDEKAAEQDASGPEGSHEKSWTYDMLRKGHLLGQRVGYEKGYAEGARRHAELASAHTEARRERSAAQAEAAALREEVVRLKERLGEVCLYCGANK